MASGKDSWWVGRLNAARVGSITVGRNRRSDQRGEASESRASEVHVENFLTGLAKDGGGRIALTVDLGQHGFEAAIRQNSIEEDHEPAHLLLGTISGVTVDVSSSVGPTYFSV